MVSWISNRFGGRQLVGGENIISFQIQNLGSVNSFTIALIEVSLYLKITRRGNILGEETSNLGNETGGVFLLLLPFLSF